VEGWNLNEAEKLLNHFDRIARSEPRFVQVSDEGFLPAVHVAIYRGFPEPAAITGFTFGLSHFHPPGGGHKELTISMLDSDDRWVLACGVVAFQLRERLPFVCGDRIDFRAQIANSSSMSAFVTVHPRHIPPIDTVIDLGIRQVELVQLVPLYEKEREWLTAGGSLDTFLKAYSGTTLLNPQRPSFVSE
jgi:hypothetical protein